jgi:general stress protein 26
LKNKILGVLKDNKLASVATLKGAKPWVRYMVVNNKDLELFAATSIASRKVEQIKANENVHVTIGGDPQNWKKSFVNIQATAEVCTDIATKREFWNDTLKAFFKGPDDPDFAVLKIKPEVMVNL